MHQYVSGTTGRGIYATIFWSIQYASWTFALSLQLQGWYRYWTLCVNPELKLVHLQSWFRIHPLLQKLHQFGCIMYLCTHYCTPVGELVRCIPTAKQSLSNELHWETAVAVVWNSFGNPTVYIGPDLLSFLSLEREKFITRCAMTYIHYKTNHKYLHSKLYKVTLVLFANEMLLHLHGRLLLES